MNMWDRFGNLSKGVGDWFGDIGTGIVAPIKFAWDVASAPWNDAPEYNGFVNTLKSASDTAARSLGRPLGGVISASVHVAENIVRQPLSATLLYAQSGDWNKSWEARNEISAGQSLVGAVGKVVGGVLPDSIGPAFTDSTFDIFDKTKRELAFKNSIYGRVTTGTLDFAADMFLDPTLAVGKLGKLAKAGDSLEVMAKGINAARAGEVNKYSKMAENFAANDGIYAQKHAWVRSGNEQGVSAYYLGQSKTKDEALNVMAALTGDRSGIEGLVSLKRPDLANPLYASIGWAADDTIKAAMFTPEGRTAQRTILAEQARLNASQEEDMLTLFTRPQAEIDLEHEYLNAWAAHDKMAADLYAITDSGSMSIKSGLGKFTQPTADFLAQARSVPFHTGNKTGIVEEYYQPTAYHKLYAKLSWAERERPAGIANLNEASSIDEVTATVTRIISLSKDDTVFGKSHGLNYIEKYAKASSPEARASVIYDLEAAGFSAIAKRYNASSEDAIGHFKNFLAKRGSAVTEAKLGNYLYDAQRDAMVKASPFESQTANFLPIADFDVVKRLLKANQGQILGASNKATSMVRGALNESTTLAEQANDIWKASVLLRLGYPVRNAVDSQLRIFATVGALATMRHVGGGLKNTAGNLRYNKVGNRVVDAFHGIGKRNYDEMSKEYADSIARIIKERKEMATALADATKKGLLKDNAVVADMAGRKVQIDALAAATEIQGKALARLERVRTGSGKKHMAEGSVTLKSRVFTPKGEEIKANDAFGMANAEFIRAANSGEHTYQSFLNSYVTSHGISVASKGVDAVKPGDVHYYQSWAEALNGTFRNSYVVRELLKNPNVDEVAKTVRDNAAFRKRLGITRDESLSHVIEVKKFVDNYIPKGFGLEKMLLDRSRTGMITPAFLRDKLKTLDELPTVHGHLLDEAVNMNSRNIVDNTMKTLFKYLGSMPEDNWARHPLYVDLYRKSLQERFAAAEFRNGERFTQAQFAEIQYNLEKAASDDAIRGVKKTLYNVERRTNAAHLLRFVSPFFSAQENALKTWMKIGTENVGILSRAGTIWTAPNRMGIATDQNGEIVPMGNAVSANDTMWFELPKGVAKFLHVDTLNQIGISKRSVDVIFQGNPLGVSVGPFVGVPVGYLAKAKPEVADLLSFAFPYGPDASVKQLMPTWGRRLLERQKGVDDADYAKAFQLIWLTEQHKARDNGTPYLTEKQVKEKTNQYYSMRTLASAILPFAPQFKSPYRYYMDQWRVYQDKFGLEADSKFLEDYPDFFDFATTLSKNTTGMEASMSAVGNAKKYNSLISEIAKDSPDLIGLITNGSGGMEYSPTASWWQSETQVSPGDPMKFRETGTPEENIAKNEARKGWAEYRQAMSVIDGYLAKRGLTSITQRGAEDLKAMKDKLVASIANRYDPVTGMSTGEPSAWYVQYRDVDGSKSARTIAGFRKILSNSKFIADNENSPTWKSVAYYIQLRDSIAQQLASRSSTSVDSKDNQDLRIQLDYYVNKLKREDITFADIYDRYLSQDKIYDKNLGLGG